MTIQRLGKKKTAIVEQAIGYRVSGAWTRGGWPHYWAQTWLVGLDSLPFHMNPPHVNFKTKEVDWGNFDPALLEKCEKLE